MCKLFLRNSLCANVRPDRKHGVEQGSPTGLQAGARHAASVATGLRSSQSHSQTSFHLLPQRNEGELPQTCKNDRKKVTFF